MKGPGLRGAKIRWTETTGTDKQKRKTIWRSLWIRMSTRTKLEPMVLRRRLADLMDTAETMTVFITRAVEAKLRERAAMISLRRRKGGQ